MPPKRTFGPDAESGAADANERTPHHANDSPHALRTSARVSFSAFRKPSFSLLRRSTVDEEAGEGAAVPDKPAIPSALQQSEAYTTPLPTLSMVVLSIAMLGEFLSANVSAPFILFMVQGFNQFEDEAKVGYWTGILVSTFFLTQFLTSLLWATVAAKHGARIVLFISLLGSAVTCCVFGTATSIEEAVAIRLMQGIFAGAIGVARGCVTMITDQSNEGRAYAILGFCWGFGGVAGAIVGGTFESPAKKWPSVFANTPIFVQYPYLLPTAVAASVTFIGAILSLFLGPDGGPREGAIRLPAEKFDTIPEEEESVPSTPLLGSPERRTVYGSLRHKLSGRLSGYFSNRGQDAQEGPSTPRQAPESEPVPLTLTPSNSANKMRTVSSTSRANGSAYGYGNTYRSRLASGYTLRNRASVTASLRERRESNLEGLSSSMATDRDLNFAQRLLMANENAVTNIADLWVAAAINVDNEDPFESEDEFEAEAEEDAQEGGEGMEVSSVLDDLDEEDVFSGQGATSTLRNSRFSRRESHTSVQSQSKRPSFSTQRRPPPLGSPRRPSYAGRLSVHRQRSSQFSPRLPSEDPSTPPMHRRASGSMPTIFAHVGVRTPPAVAEAQQLFTQLEEQGPSDTLDPIMESQRVQQAQLAEAEVLEEPSLMSLLPVAIIIQYGLLALHSTTHDQVFYLYLVSKYPLGGLNLNAGHFSQLIALMCLAQIAYQFYLYPNIGPPRGRFSHLAMFRIGSLLFIPAYLSVILYRVFASPNDDGNPILMAALALSTAVRFCGSTFAYTAVSVLLNYMSPPHVVGFANGIAQSIVSLARFMGPILGGTLWSMSVENGPAGYPLGFIACAVACALAVAHSFVIR
ncbi:major facilitator superfamily MFS-1 [Daedalea quercina L-15889]|uniref:Major facilitator superfamily MFS-1 n=1 Tax=Daedalea quercina L-15889 TaxID=1314783 RepID=A0A165QTR2_9APHY|nr:major facilitator superfamily MFS-1 [Daedalea quercina L-15889]